MYIYIVKRLTQQSTTNTTIKMTNRKIRQNKFLNKSKYLTKTFQSTIQLEYKKKNNERIWTQSGMKLK